MALEISPARIDISIRRLMGLAFGQSMVYILSGLYGQFKDLGAGVCSASHVLFVCIDVR